MHEVRTIDAAALKALAHPLRVQLLGRLRAEGPATATELAARLGGTSGTTSWHLRKLADAGLITEAPGTSGRERRWRVAQRSLQLRQGDHDADAETRAAADTLIRLWADNHVRWLHDWLDARPGYEPAWADSYDLSDALLRLTPSRALALAADLLEVVERHRQESAAVADDPLARPVAVSWHIVPRVDLDPAAGRPE